MTNEEFAIKFADKKMYLASAEEQVIVIGYSFVSRTIMVERLFAAGIPITMWRKDYYKLTTKRVVYYNYITLVSFVFKEQLKIIEPDFESQLEYLHKIYTKMNVT